MNREGLTFALQAKLIPSWFDMHTVISSDGFEANKSLRLSRYGDRDKKDLPSGIYFEVMLCAKALVVQVDFECPKNLAQAVVRSFFKVKKR